MKKLIVAGAVATLLVAAPAAFGQATKLEGTIENDTNAVVKLKTELNQRGVVKRITGLTFKDVDYDCANTNVGETSFEIGNGKVTKTIVGSKVQYTFDITNDGGANESFNVQGTSNKNGTKVKARLNFYFLEPGGDPADGGICRDVGRNDGVPWTAKQK